jgi:hypothetical protein
MSLSTNNVVESKSKCKSDNVATDSCKAMTLDGKVNILDMLRGGLCAAAVGLTFCTLSPNSR